MNRSLSPFIKEDLLRKIILVTRPRQSGETTLSRMLVDDFDYFNFDNPEHRVPLLERSQDRKQSCIILDELHKLKNWKGWLKGIYDTEGIPPALLVTGSPVSYSSQARDLQVSDKTVKKWLTILELKFPRN
jgi:predicted AAA+ superfamily ATPase